MHDVLRPAANRVRRGAWVVLAAAATVTSAAACTGGTTSSGPAGVTAATTTATGSVPAGPVTGPTLVAAGDLVCEPGSRTTAENCRQQETSDLALSLRPDAVAVLGDDQYEDGTAEAFRTGYDPTWGRLKALTRPAVGNHEYRTRDAAGYFGYFGGAAGEPGKGWYSYDLGSWHVVVLNSNCGNVPCADDGEQVRWLRADLAAHPASCTLAYWHHPRWSDGEHGDDGDVAPFVRALHEAGADVVLSGHDHDYERFAPMSPDGSADPGRGLREFVVGTGGKSHYATGRRATTEAVSSDTFGVLALTLGQGSYAWRFVPVAGSSFTDSGAAGCH